MNLKTLAIVRPKQTGDPKIDKYWGLLRTFLAVVAGFLLSTGKIDIGADPEAVLSLLDKILEYGYQIAGFVTAFITAISSWFSKPD